ncbi:MAG TPA: hypothetical protein VM782_12040, partial [Stellaceae bacterium]|nr:hypothetical protein [Stellaceae bacterium]
RIDEAEAIASAALARHPDDTDFLIEHLWLAVARGDWPEVPGRLEHARRIAREPARFDQSVRWIDERLALLSKQAATTPAAPAVLSSLEPEAEADEVSPMSLMLAFESIGERCDFGAVQRHFGVEPLGLLRFAWTRFDSLIAALEDRFEAVGTVEDTEFALYGDETILRMKKYGLIFHTFIYRMDEEPPEKREAFYQQQRRRLLFLKDKLVADLQDPQKICVYSTNEWAADDHITRLASALRAYGPSSLLYVRPERDKRPSGFVEALEDGLYAGYFPGLAEFVRGGQPPFELWRQLCARTFRLSRAGSDNAGFLKTLL